MMSTTIIRKKKRLAKYLAHEMNHFLDWVLTHPEKGILSTEELSQRYVDQVASRTFLPLIEKILSDK